jgi:3-polyprenyl-4-hydroxybenzoate decarboxylase
MRLVVAVTGASGAIYARRTLELLSQQVSERGVIAVDWVCSATSENVWETELGEPLPRSIPALRRWDRHDFAAPFASGSNAPDAGEDLIARACEVALKERRRLILVVRETPLSLVHLRNMVAATEAGAIVLPAVPSFYAGIRTLEQAVDTVVARALDHAGVRLALLPRWGEVQNDG